MKKLLIPLLVLVVSGTAVLAYQPIVPVQPPNTTVQPIAPVPPNVPLACVSLRQSLRLGSRGAEVIMLQQFLEIKGFYTQPRGVAYGYFGPLTQAAVIRFQERYASDILFPNGLTRGNGFVGPSTIAKIKVLSCGSRAASNTSTNSISNSANANSSIRVTGPNGGESWGIGSARTVSWTGSGQFDLQVKPYLPCLDDGSCAARLTPRTLARNVSGNSFSWQVGSVVDNLGAFLPGQYKLFVCNSGTGNCDNSDGPFTVVNITY